MIKALKACVLSIVMILLFVCFSPPGAVFAAGRTAEDSTVRVLLTKLALTDRLGVSLDGSYTLNGLSFQRGSRLLVSLRSGTLMVYYEGMAMDCGKKLRLVRHQLTDPGEENGLRLNGGYDLHPGDLVLTAEGGQIRAVLHAPVEEYLWGVVPYEMSDSYPIEALKVQAICSRTYALSKKAASDADYDVVDNTNDQAYYGIRAENVRSLEAIRATEGICGYDKSGDLLRCYYSASNGGQTECVSHVWGGSDPVYLPLRDDPYDLENPGSTVRSFRLGKVSSVGFGALEDTIIDAVTRVLDPHEAGPGITGSDIVIVSCQAAGPMYPGSRIMTELLLDIRVSVIDDDGEKEVYLDPAAAQAQDDPEQTAVSRSVRTVSVSLPVFPTVESLCGLDINRGSNNEIVSVRETGDSYHIEARRFGHGVGMSQRGAQQMAQEYGMKAEDILAFYYPGADFVRSSHTAPSMPTPVSAEYLTTPGPAATPTPRPTLMPVQESAERGLYMVIVSNIGENSYLNLRSQPSMNSSVLRQLYYGQLLSVLDESGDGWLHVCTDAAEGYVSASFVEVYP